MTGGFPQQYFRIFMKIGWFVPDFAPKGPKHEIIRRCVIYQKEQPNKYQYVCLPGGILDISTVSVLVDQCPV
jgi:hypothetical protein